MIMSITEPFHCGFMYWGTFVGQFIDLEETLGEPSHHALRWLVYVEEQQKTLELTW